MSYVADLHLHSSYARGTSKELRFETMARWARIKGIDLLASADFTHPAWFQETARTLREAGDGLYEHDGIKFILGTEVNCLGEVGGRKRRVHLLVFAPSLETVERINSTLAPHGKLGSDGRPTLHLSARDLTLTLMDLDPRCFVMPAHAWTPWFGVFGSKSGFDSLEECFGDASEHIYAIESGLSSEPAMNHRIPELDNRSIVSFSDAHSLPKMGRELTVFAGEPSYDGLAESLKDQSIDYTVEFFPQEGKYHYSGHRKCGVALSPRALEEVGVRCPECGRPLTLGVMQRVEELAARPAADVRTGDDGLTASADGRPPFRMLISLQQIIAESLGVGPSTKTTQREYFKLCEEIGSELAVLVKTPVADVARVSGERVAEALARVRSGDISIEPGYDGRYGTVKVWPE